MKLKMTIVGIAILLICVTGAGAMMTGGNGTGPDGGHMGGGYMGGGKGYGMDGAGGMVSGMMGNTIFYGYLDVLNPIGTAAAARDAIEAFIIASNSNLQISELWEYETVYKAELPDANGAKAFDLLADKFTGAVMPEMGLSMMLNASYGKGLYKTASFGKALTITPEQAATHAQNFIDTNGLGYTLGSPETYPGYYKFHTTTSTGPGMEIMVSGYDGGIWMNTLFGVPVAKY